ncbi:amidase domain-containing protein [Paenibacillus sp. SC116]|uniref:amidase domain-containing protein n=1 Tax=Paenibacillus sp. SC116 TaxID=2968986 RepID=UPI00215A512D|nr:amidase domain-containing protein [Paenibacillus sp. SC116]MCR8844930.1 amidase domain-containing protein [Paenibacillus sp. SC116]
MKKKLKSAFVATVVCATFLSSSQAFAATILFTNPDTINSSFNRSGAADYAEKWATTANPNFANYGSNSDGGDCTNFVSQALYVGGSLPFNGTKGKNRFTEDWYYYGPHVPPATNPRTSSWTAAHQFRQHFAVVNDVGGKKAWRATRYTSQELVSNFQPIYDELFRGDVVQHVDSAGHTFHTQIVNGYGPGNDLKVAQHSTNSNVWNKDISLKSYATYGNWMVSVKIKK